MRTSQVVQRRLKVGRSGNTMQNPGRCLTCCSGNLTLLQALRLPDFWPFLAFGWVAAWLTWKSRGLGLTLLPEDLLGKASTCRTASSAP